MAPITNYTNNSVSLLRKSELGMTLQPVDRVIQYKLENCLIRLYNNA